MLLCVFFVVCCTVALLRSVTESTMNGCSDAQLLLYPFLWWIKNHFVFASVCVICWVLVIVVVVMSFFFFCLVVLCALCYCCLKYYLCACVRMCEWAACLPEVCLLLLQIKDYVWGNCKQTSVADDENECIYLLLVVHLSLSFRFSLKAY